MWPFKRHKDEQPTPVASTDAEGGTPAVVEPEVTRRKIKQVKIDTENFEAGAFAGTMSIEDFGVNGIVGASFGYHITEDFFAQATIARTKAARTSYELLSGAAELLTDSERQLTYYDLSFGYNLLPGEIFVGRKRAYNTALYVTAGVGSTKFAGDSRFTVSVGAGYRVLVKDWLALHVGVNDHIFEHDLFGVNKTSHNLETIFGITGFF
jgi:outer membrane beta-barrel protein